MYRLGLAILVGLLLAASTPGFGNEKDPEKPDFEKEIKGLWREYDAVDQRLRETCPSYERYSIEIRLRCAADLAIWYLWSRRPPAAKWAVEMVAAENRERVQAVLDTGVDADVQDGKGNSPLLRVSFMSGDPELIAMLLKAGANPNLSNEGGNTPLILATMQGYWPAVEMLLKHGADKTVNARGYLEYTALHWAASGGHPEIALALLRSGADPYARVGNNRTALHLAHEGRERAIGSAVRHYETIKIIRQAQAMIARQMKGGTPRKERKPRLRLHPL